MRIVLVRPRDPNNIGAAARAMANFGLADLVVVDPYEPTWREARSAVGADAVLASARCVAALEEAVADCTFVGATTAGTRRVHTSAVTPDVFLAEALPEDRVALVFGNEKHGLTNDQIALCHRVVTIPTSTEQPSLNLAQAVAISCYVASGVARPAVRARRQAAPSTVEQLDELVAATIPGAEDQGVESRRSSARGRLRTLLLRARPTASELALLRGLLAPGRRK